MTASRIFCAWVRGRNTATAGALAALRTPQDEEGAQRLCTGLYTYTRVLAQGVRVSATPHGAGASATFSGESRGLDADLYIVEVSADLEVAAP